ncbi:MAG: YifB family Mg chelatase-like AAA ATPase [Clostridiales bacterium]|nr:YifB family Mg chelatase-like AAA ATPase [Clostridiales bacterium]
MFSAVSSVGVFGMQSYMVNIEADISMGKFKFDVVGLPDTAVTESRERVRTAMKNSGYDFPCTHITVNLAPADIKKEGPIYDLPILIAIMKSSKQLVCDLDGSCFIGELSLGGEVHHVNGVLSMVMEAKNSGMKRIFIPADNEPEASVVDGIEIYAVKTVKQVIDHLMGYELIPKVEHKIDFEKEREHFDFDFADVKGQFQAKRALEVAAAGGHNVLMIGPPGSGKSMLAKRIPSILPDMAFDESLETTKIYSVSGHLPKGVSLISTRPFRSPHHSVSAAGLSGGGSIPKPGEVSLAHNGVLFLDELPEFSRTAMESLRQPIEDGTVSISRVAGTLTYPCSVMLVCAMNPCPCGYYGHPTRKCTCPQGTPARYLSKVSGPLLDRLDIHIEVPQVKFEDLSDAERGEPSEKIRLRVNAARKIQEKRFENTKVTSNAHMTAEMTRKFCVLTDGAAAVLKRSFDDLGLSARAYDKILRIARTVADLDGSLQIDIKHITEAIQYRSLDRKFWNNI